ncbi:hypothetical protein BDR26DRAFT_606397 [Obelidium mucronatum]|nr:hypothetical protein BDR26DRAFT_606397 [Obelidium mucronatum]
MELFYLAALADEHDNQPPNHQQPDQQQSHSISISLNLRYSASDGKFFDDVFPLELQGIVSWIILNDMNRKTINKANIQNSDPIRNIHKSNRWNQQGPLEARAAARRLWTTNESIHLDCLHYILYCNHSLELQNPVFGYGVVGVHVFWVSGDWIRYGFHVLL